MKSKVTCITINTDASWCPETNASGYAFYAICDKFKIMKSGNFRSKPNSSWEAELFVLGTLFIQCYPKRSYRYPAILSLTQTAPQ